MDFQSQAAIVFIIILTILVFLGRKKLAVEKVLYPVVYILMYRTKVGIIWMDRTAKRFPRFFKYAGYAGVFIGFAGMGMMCYGLIDNIVKMLTEPTAPGAALVLPFKVKGALYVPFFFWILCLFILVIIHEFSHGVISRLYNLKIKSSGLAVLGIIVPVIPAAFVEPEEKDMIKKPKKKQLSVFAAGSFSNIILGSICLGLLLLFMGPVINSVVDYNGVMVGGIVKEENKTLPAEIAGMNEGEIIDSIDGNAMLSSQRISDYLQTKNPGDIIEIKTNRTSYSLELGNHPLNESVPYMGMYLANYLKAKSPSFADIKQNLLSSEEKISKDDTEFILAQTAGLIEVPIYISFENGSKYLVKTILWTLGLVFWLFLLNIGIGLFNLVPIPITDGGRMMYLALLYFFEEKRAAKIWKGIAIFFGLLIVINLGFGFLR